MKKILCILLVVALLAAVMCVPAFAAEGTNITVDGVELPHLPAGVDYSVYKYAFVAKQSNGYYLYLFSSLSNFYKFDLNEGGYVESAFFGSGSFLRCELIEDNFSWGSVSDFKYSSGRILVDIVWSSFDIYSFLTGLRIMDGSAMVVDGGGFISNGLSNLTDNYLNTGLNGMYYPELPLSVDLEEYPYVLAVKVNDGVNYYFYSELVPFHVTSFELDGLVRMYPTVDTSFLLVTWKNGVYSAAEERNQKAFSTFNVIASSFNVYDASTGELVVPRCEMFTADGRVYPSDFQGVNVYLDSVGETLNTGVSMLGSVAQTIATTPLLFVCFTVGFIGLGVALFKRIRK